MSLTKQELRSFVLRKIADIGSYILTIDAIQVFEASEEELNEFIKIIFDYCRTTGSTLTFEDASIAVHRKKLELSKWAYRLKEFFINKDGSVCGRMTSGCEYVFDAQEEKWTKLK